MLRVALVCAMLVAAAYAQSSADPITDLPGYSGTVPFDQYSGYVYVNETGNNLFYWFVESQNDPANDPLVLWMTGGPGCSGLLGLLTENGPFHVNDTGKELWLNPYSWNTVANVIYIEQPKGVGFSYNDQGNYTSGDNDASYNNYMFLLGFLELFPQFKNNEFFIAGESYGGHYVPQLGQRIVNGNNAGVNPKINFQGWAVGNPSTDNEYDANSYFTFMANHALVRQVDYNNAAAVCDNQFNPPLNTECSNLVKNLTQNFATINPYDIYQPCLGGGPGSPGVCFTQQTEMAMGLPPRSQTFVPCIVTNVTSYYLNQPSVREALHVRAQAQANWTVCSQILQYDQAATTVIPIYQELVGNSSLRIMIYSGDVDSCVNYLGTEQCVNAMNFTVAPGGHWRPWMINENDGRLQTAGYVVDYVGNFSYLTIKDAGHMVPQFQPARALAFFTAFIQNTPWPGA